uniref:Uncharacterized protein n=1 Tax=Aegilops tauschii subsp. strangulata TaxID=200361 RepID=A0A453NDD7_AEGTS
MDTLIFSGLSITHIGRCTSICNHNIKITVSLSSPFPLLAEPTTMEPCYKVLGSRVSNEQNKMYGKYQCTTN